MNNHIGKFGSILLIVPNWYYIKVLYIWYYIYKLNTYIVYIYTLCGQRSLVDYSPWGRKESDMIEVTNTHAHTTCDS